LSKIFSKKQPDGSRKKAGNFPAFFLFLPAKKITMKPTARKIKEKFFYPTPVFGQPVAPVIQVKTFHYHGFIMQLTLFEGRVYG